MGSREDQKEGIGVTKISSGQVAALRAVLVGDLEEHNRAYEQLDSGARASYALLVGAAFFEAAYRRFGKEGKASDVVAFVGDVRARSDRLATDIDPRIAERLILATFTDEQIDDIDDGTKGRHYILLLAGLIVDAALSEAELDELLADARKTADEWLN